MSTGNFLFEEGRAYGLSEKAVDKANTVKVGSAANSFHADRVITVASLDDGAFTITLPDGIFRGQRFLAVITSASTLSANVTVTTGTNDYKLKYVRDYVSLEWIGSGDKGWIYLSKSAT